MVTRSKKKTRTGAFAGQLLLRLLPVQAAIVAMGSINTIVDGAMAGRFIDGTTVGVVGMYSVMLKILEAVGNMILAGTTVLCGKYLGSGDLDRTRGVCSLGTTLAFILGAFMTILSFAAPEQMAAFLGANEALTGPLCLYIQGYAVGILPQLLGQQLAVFLQLERQDRRSQVAIGTMIVSNMLLDVLLVGVLRMGIWGLALATSLSNWAYFIVLASYYLSDKAQLRPNLLQAAWSHLPQLLKIGLPAAVMVFCLAMRGLVFNRLILQHVGQDGLSAMGALNLVGGLVLACVLGAGSAIRMLCSVYLGEENREDLLEVMRLVLTKLMVVILGLTVVFYLAAPILAAIFFPERGNEVYGMTKQLFHIYALCMPFILFAVSYNNYVQAAGHHLFVGVISAIDGFFSVVIPGLLLVPVLGSLGAWLTFPIGSIITVACSLLYSVLVCRHWPRSLDEWLMLPSDFGNGERLVLTLERIELVTDTARQVQDFCLSQGMLSRTAFHAALCLEENAANIVQHGFAADKKSHIIEVRVLKKREGEILLRTKDNCIRFDPQERYEMIRNAPDPFANIGMRLIYGLASYVSYQNLLGLNVLTITLREEAGA